MHRSSHSVKYKLYNALITGLWIIATLKYSFAENKVITSRPLSAATTPSVLADNLHEERTISPVVWSHKTENYKHLIASKVKSQIAGAMENARFVGFRFFVGCLRTVQVNKDREMFISD